MAIRITRGKADKTIDSIKAALASYQRDHPSAGIDLYRQNAVSVRVRIVDPSFTGQNKVERNQRVWQYFDDLPDNVQSDISMMVLLAPSETTMSMANLEFEDPVPSKL